MVKRLTSLMLACCVSVLSCTTGTHSFVKAEAVDALALKNAEIVINTVNDIRVSYGLPELATTPVLLEVSDIRAKELAVKFDHTRPDGTKCFTALQSSGISYSFVAENIAAGRSDPVATVDQWMKSDGHRANILSESYSHIGIGYYYDPDSSYSYHWSMFLIGVYDGKDPHIFDGQYIPSRELGDVNGTKSINASDAAAILQYSASTAVGASYPVVRDFKKAGDVNGDGTINSIDASIILSYTAAKGSGADVKLEDFIW